MKNNQFCEPVQDLSVSIPLSAPPNRPGTEVQPDEFEQMLHQAWLILSAPGSGDQRLSGSQNQAH